MNVFIEKYTYLAIFSLFGRESIRKSSYLNICLISSDNQYSIPPGWVGFNHITLGLNKRTLTQRFNCEQHVCNQSLYTHAPIGNTLQSFPCLKYMLDWKLRVRMVFVQ